MVRSRTVELAGMVRRQRGERCVLVTDVQELAGMGAARALGRAGYRVIGVYPSGAPPPAAGSSRYIHEFDCSPNPWLDLPRFEAWLREFCTSRPIDGVLPISEASTLAAHRARTALGPNVRLVIANAAGLEVALSKYASNATACGVVAAPRTWFLCDGHDVDTLALSQLLYPCIVRTDNALLEDGRYVKGSTWKVASVVECEAVLEECLGMHSRAIAQEPVPGRGVGAFVFRAGGEIRLALTHERIHEVPYTGGWSSLRAVSENSAVLQAAASLLEKVGFEGLAMVEFRETPGHPPVFIEINGRLWGSLALALHAGRDFPTAAVDSAFGLGSDAPQPARKVRCVNLYPGEVGYLVSVVRGRHATRWARLHASLRALSEVIGAQLNPRVRGDFLWWDDPGPGLHQLGKLLRFIVRRAAGALTHRRAVRHVTSEALRGAVLSGARRILMICSGNICRSAFAEHLLRDELRAHGVTDVEVRSAGLHARPGERYPQRFRNVIASLGVQMDGHRSKLADEAGFDESDVIVVMERCHADEIAQRFPRAAARTVLLTELAGEEPALDVPDPYLQAPAAASDTFRRVAESVRRIAGRIAADTRRTRAGSREFAA